MSSDHISSVIDSQNKTYNWDRYREAAAAWGAKLEQLAQSRWFCAGLLTAGFALYWGCSKAAEWWNLPTERQIVDGGELFQHNWGQGDALAMGGDGLGPVFNERSCVACHFQGGVGGGGDNRFNVTAFDVFPDHGRPKPATGVIHAFAVSSNAQESQADAKARFRTIPAGAVINGVCFSRRTDFDPIIQHSVNTPALFGSGAIDRISPWSIRAAHTSRGLSTAGKEFQLEFDQPSIGRLRVLPDGRIGKYGWKGQFATLKEFVAAACAMELGLSNPMKRQPVPGRFEEDRDAKLDLTGRQLAALNGFVASLPEPKLQMPYAPAERALAQRGETFFHAIGCASCHTPEIDGVKGIYTDFCLHDLSEDDGASYNVDPDIELPNNFPRPEEWKTPPLWGVADTAPYFHDGSATTLRDAILKHGGGARHVRKRFKGLKDEDQDAVIAFLETMRAPQGLPQFTPQPHAAAVAQLP